MTVTHRRLPGLAASFALASSTALWILGSFAPARAQDDDRGLGRRTTERRLALVVGNDAYRGAPLRNAVSDARSLSDRLRSLGFDVTTLTDAHLRDLDRAVQEFTAKLNPGDVGLFFYAGHGMQVDGLNYLVPVDFSAGDAIDAKYDAYPAQKVLEKMEASGSRLNIVILDACRNNPFKGARGGIEGLAQMSSGRGSYVAFATAPNGVASDNPGGRNGLFTSQLLDVLGQPNLRLNDVFDRVRERVYMKSNERQLPWTSSSVIGDFVFNPRDVQPPPIASPPPADVATPRLRVPSAEDVQRELKRLELYFAAVNGKWGPISKQAALDYAALLGEEEIDLFDPEEFARLQATEDIYPKLDLEGAFRGFSCDVSSVGGEWARQKREQISRNMYSRYGCTESPMIKSKPGFVGDFHSETLWGGFAWRSSVIYYDKRNATKAHALARELSLRYGHRFFATRGGGQGILPEWFSRGLVIHVHQNGF